MRNMLKRRRLWLIVGGLLFVLFVLPFLIPLGATGVNPAALASEIETGNVPDNVDPALVAALSAPASRYVEVNGVQTYVVEQGAVGGEAVVFIHGFGGSTFSWRLNLNAVAEAGYRAVAFDLPPFGLSTRPASFDYSHDGLAEFTAALLDALNIEQATLVGHSMGGSVIAHFALKYPQRVDKLIFVAGAVNVSDNVGGLSGLLSFPPAARWLQVGVRTFITPERMGEILMSAYYNPGFIDPTVQTGYQLPLRTEGWDTGLVAYIRDAGSSSLTPQQITQINATSLLLWGEEDTWVPLSRGQTLADTLPNAILQTYPRVGHLPMEEIADAFNLDLITFLQTGELPDETEFFG